MKYSKKRVQKICQLIESDDYTIPEVCKYAGIGESTYHDWRNKYPEFLEAVKKAEEKRLELFRKAARSGLLTLLRGKEYEEVTTEYVEGKPDKDGNTKPKIKSQKKVKKFILPNPTSVIFALKNLDADHFADLFKSELSGSKGGPLQVIFEEAPGCEPIKDEPEQD
jgi:transposase-like protein